MAAKKKPVKKSVKKSEYVKCPHCNGGGVMVGGTSIAMPYASRWECECCCGKGKIPRGRDPNWWMQSDNAPGNGGR